MSIFTQYIELTKQYRQEHGDKTALLMQVGGFYELYGLCDENNTYIDNYSKLYDICLTTGLKISVKDSSNKINGCSVVMAGFRTYSLEKYLKIIIDAGYACVVYDQDEQKSGTTRSLQAVYTPGTYFDNEDTTISNTIACCWIHKFKNIVVVGMSCINILTGKNYIYEYERLYEISPETFDELERFISTFTPNEVLIIHNLRTLVPKTLIDLCNIPQTTRTCVIDINDTNSSESDKHKKRAYNCSKQTYQDEIYTRFFAKKMTSIVSSLLCNYAIASQSYCYLLDYIYQNNPYLISNIEVPSFENQSDRIVLGNHSLKQLNIIRQSPKQGTTQSQTKYSNSYVEPYSEELKAVKKRYGSICDLLNYCKSNMGSRLFHYTMTHPHSNIVLLNQIYETTDYCQSKMTIHQFNSVISSLINLYDIEKIIRKVYINRLSYDDVSRLYISLRETSKICDIINHNKHQSVIDYITVVGGVSIDTVSTLSRHHQDKLEEKFTNNLLFSKTDDINIFNLGVYPTHDEKVIQYYKTVYQLNVLYYYLNEKIKLAEQSKSKTKKIKAYKREPLKLNETDRGTITFELTSTRAATLIEYCTKEATNKELLCVCDSEDNFFHKRVIDEGFIPEYLLEDDEFKTKCFTPIYLEPMLTAEKSSSNGQKTINSTIITRVLKTAQYAKTELENSVKHHFIIFMNDFKTIISDYDTIVKFCANVDMLTCYTLVAKNTNYCRPIIMATEEDSFTRFSGLRHPLIEHLLEDELYVANSISLTSASDKTEFNDAQGFLLYGTNTVGKSSFIKSIGIAVIMAQCGFYVAAEEMSYKPFRSIYTRILGNDDLFRGLSTFNVEMIELKNILNYANRNSLVLGDEVCSGTEMGSASSIFMGALEHLYHNEVKYIFATHFHNIAECEEMTALHNMKNIHLSVRYDNEHDRLLYDRKLKEGAGENMYGLEVCKYLHLPDAFIKRSYEIRNKYFNTATSLLDLKPSKYNANKLVGNCEQCGEKGSEVHHLQHQRNSDEKGFIKNAKTSHYFHKNSKPNLMVLCDKCHDKLHKESSNGHYRVSNSYNIIE